MFKFLTYFLHRFLQRALRRFLCHLSRHYTVTRCLGAVAPIKPRETGAWVRQLSGVTTPFWDRTSPGSDARACHQPDYNPVPIRTCGGLPAR